jgi:ankyrin repeat protein
LHYAAYEGHQIMVKYLVRNGINVVAVDDDGKTALQIAHERRHENIEIYLKNAELGILRKPSGSAEERLLDLERVTDL